MRSLLALSAFALLGVFVAPAAVNAVSPGGSDATGGTAYCDPRSRICLNRQCNLSNADKPGVTTMDSSQKNLIACLLDDDGIYRWKSMSPVTLSQEGNVGIGTTDPKQKLDVGTIIPSGTYAGWGTGLVRAARFLANNWDATYDSTDSITGKYYQLIGTYRGWDPNSIYIGGYNGADVGTLNGSPLPYAQATSISMGGFAKPGGPTMFVNLMNNRVGVNSTNPQASLDVNGEIRPGSTGSACTSANEGAQRYNSNTKIMEFCNGMEWKSMSGGAGGTGSLCGIAWVTSGSTSTGLNTPSPSGQTIEKCQGHNVINMVPAYTSFGGIGSFPTGSLTPVVDCPSGYHGNTLSSSSATSTQTSSGELGVDINQEGTHTYPTYTSTATTTVYTCVAD